MCSILKAYRIPDELVMAISIMYEDITVKVIIPDVEILSGVLLGDILSPYFLS